MVRAARALLEAGAKASGRPSAVVNVSSVAGISGGGSSVAYAASKGALNTMTQSLARALAPYIAAHFVAAPLAAFLESRVGALALTATGFALDRKSVV